MPNSMFRMGYDGRPFYGGGVGPIKVRITRAELERDRGAILKRLPYGPNYAGQYPYIVIVEGEGEYTVSADGTAQFYSYRQQTFEPPVSVDNQSMMAKMFDRA